MTRWLHEANGSISSAIALFRKGEWVDPQSRYLIVGLGNPGARYAHTFHNVGFMALDMLAHRWGVPIDRVKFQAHYGQTTRDGHQVILLRPDTFMNLSGEAVVAAAHFYKISPEHIVVIYDDIDLPLGTVRMRAKGSAGTHNGMRHIVQQLGSLNFPRIRIGIGPKPEGWDIVDYVLARVPQDHQEPLYTALERVADTVDQLLSHDLEYAMNRLHRSQRPKKVAKPVTAESGTPAETGEASHGSDA